MADAPKKSTNYLLIVGIIVAVLVVVIGIYLLWRKISSVESKSPNRDTVADLVTKVDQLKNDIARRDDKIHEMAQKIATLETAITELKYQVRETKSSKTARSPSKKCTDGKCEMKPNGPVEDIDS